MKLAVTMIILILCVVALAINVVKLRHVLADQRVQEAPPPYETAYDLSHPRDPRQHCFVTKQEINCTDAARPWLRCMAGEAHLMLITERFGAIDPAICEGLR